LTPKKPHDCPSSNLRKRRFGHDSPDDDSEDMSVQFPRRSPRLTPKKSHDGPSSNLRKRRIGRDFHDDDSEDMSVQGLIQFSRRKAEEEQKARLQAGQGNEKADAPEASRWSPFSELRELVGSDIRHGIDLPYIEPPEFVDDDGRAYAHRVFMDVTRAEMQVSPGCQPPLNEFGSDEAIQKLTVECFKLQNLDITDHKLEHRVTNDNGKQKKDQSVMRKKQLAHRTRPDQPQTRVSMNSSPNAETVETRPTAQKPDSVISPRIQAQVHPAVQLGDTEIAPEPVVASNTSAAKPVTNTPHTEAPATLKYPQTTQSNSNATTTAKGVVGSKPQQLPASRVTRSSNTPAREHMPRTAGHSKANPVGTTCLPDSAKQAPLQCGVPVLPATGPTRETCPPPAAKLTPSQEVREKFARAALACDAPGFDLGFDSPKKPETGSSSRPPATSTSAEKRMVYPVEQIWISDDDEWDEDTWREACDVLDRVEREKGYKSDETTTRKSDKQAMATQSGFKTPTKGDTSIPIKSPQSGSTTAADRPQAQQRRIIRQPISLKSPYIMYEDKALFTCSADVKDLYNAVIAHGRRSQRGQETDNTPIVVSYNKYFVSLQELANSMMPCGVVKNTVMELGIESIMLRTDKKLKKVVMPLRVAVSFNQNKLVLVFVHTRV
jgi:hypothetical protein